MEDFKKALAIYEKYLKKYDSDDYCNNYPFHCEHDVLMFAHMEEDIDVEDAEELDRLGFHWDEEYDCWCSFKYGSC